MTGATHRPFLGTFAADLAPEFDRVYWRSLRNALPTREWLAGVIAFVSAPNTILPEAEAARIELLLDLLGERRCLLVLDNMETVVQPGERDGRYREGYAGYGTVLQRLGESQHLSCLLLTGREAPPELGPLEGEQASVRSLELAGLTVDEGRAVLQHRGLVGEQDIVVWCRENMAAYKCPRIIEFVEALPKSGAGKIMWRELQDRETAAHQRATLP